MSDEQVFTIERVSDTTYLDDAGQVVQGVSVQVRLHEYSEVRSVNAPTDDPEMIREKIEQLLERRKLLADLG